MYVHVTCRNSGMDFSYIGVGVGASTVVDITTLHRLSNKKTMSLW